MAGKHSRTKGARIEREIVALHDTIPVAAEKVSRSGYTGEDLLIADEFKAEVKARKGGFKLLKRWIEGMDLLFLREDGDRFPMVVMPWGTYAHLMGETVSASDPLFDHKIRLSYPTDTPQAPLPRSPERGRCTPD